MLKIKYIDRLTLTDQKIYVTCIRYFVRQKNGIFVQVYKDVKYKILNKLKHHCSKVPSKFKTLYPLVKCE